MLNPGLDYFPLDVHLDDKFELIEAEFGLTGFAVVVKLFQKIYGEQGYYCEWTNEVALLFAKKVGLGGSAVSEIVRASIKRGIFDQNKFDEHRILTSAGIQRRYFEASSRRKNLKIESSYLLLNYDDLKTNVRNSLKNVDNFEKNADNFNETKRNEMKRDEMKRDEGGGFIFESLPEWSDFIAIREQKGKLTDKAKRLIQDDLTKFSGGKTDAAVKILRYSIKGGYPMLYPLNEKEQRKANSSFNLDEYELLTSMGIGI